jgi:general secretion pathway protein E
MRADALGTFAGHLARKFTIAGDLLAKTRPSDRHQGDIPLRNLWEASDLPANEFADEVAEFYGLSRLSLPELSTATALVARFSHRFLRESVVFPYQAPDLSFRLAVADPTDEAAIRAAEIVLGGPVAIDVASFEDLETILASRLGEDDSEHAEQETARAGGDDDIESLRDLASGAPVVRAVNDLLEKAVELRATDIHVEPFRTGLVVRMRVDGLLRAMPSPAGALPQAVISRIKILAGLNIAERRLPQDGAARVRVARSEIDIRVATMPTQHGESAVIRLLPRDRGLLDITKLGLSQRDESRLSRLLKLPHGMLVITGPTGSGKTTTLATMLTILNETTRKILTVEDPVEYELHGVNQTQVKPSIGLSFAAAMRSFLRHDPDVIMVGEVRDTETAHIAIHAALTGHLVLTTLHTETAAGAVPRLLDLGAESFLLQSTLRAMIAQRLVRILCERCKAEHRLTHTDLSEDPRYAMLGLRVGESVWEPRGCERCGNTGYRGRLGVFEIIETTEDVRTLIAPHTDSGTIEKAAANAGMTSMIDDAVAKCRAGVTSAAEVLRVTTVR